MVRRYTLRLGRAESSRLLQTVLGRLRHVSTQTNTVIYVVDEVTVVITGLPASIDQAVDIVNLFLRESGPAGVSLELIGTGYSRT